MQDTLKVEAAEFSNFSNTFTMKRVAETNAPTVVVYFTPSPLSSGVINSTDDGIKSHPIFNNDGNYFTPTFMLHQDKIKINGSLQLFLDMHENRVLETIEEKDEIFVAKPSKTNSFCCVCKQYYDDYLAHINLQAHQQNLEKNKFKKDIDQLCKNFGKEKEQMQKKIKVAKNKTIRKQTVKSVSRSHKISNEENKMRIKDIRQISIDGKNQ